jgi:hypothetical protein
MAEVSKAPQAQVPQEMETVTVPEKNILGWEHPVLAVNLRNFGPGKHLVSAELAGELNKRIRRHSEDCVRLLNNKVDPIAIRKQNTMV